MAHLDLNNHHWYLQSPFALNITVSGVDPDDLSDLAWRIDGLVNVINIIVNGDEDAAEVTVVVDAEDTAPLSKGVYDWQLQGNIQGTGPQVIAIGKIRFDPLALPPTPYSFIVETEEDDEAVLIGAVS